MDPDEAAKPFGFHSKSHSARAAVLFAGPAMNLILPIFVFAAMAVTTGMPKFTSDGPVMQLSVDSVKPKSEAARIGLRKGDVITSVDGQPCDFEAAIETIHRSIGKPVRLGVKRGNTTLQLVGTPQAMRDDNGKLVLDDGKQIGVLGFVPFTQWQLERIGLLQGVARGAILSFDVVRQIVTNLTPSKLSKEGAGVIEIGRTTHSMVEHGIAYLLFWLALLSLNLAVINLLPIPVLDGGHLMILFADKLYGLMRKGATLSARTVAALNYLGLATLLTIFILFMINDINRIQR
jgi:regulator of sigma E protease